MPFIKRSVDLGPTKGLVVPPSLCGDFDAFSNAALANVLRQLGTLMQHANNMFLELEKECMVTFMRSQQVKAKIWSLEETVESLDHKSVKIRSVDLKSSELISLQHYESRQVCKNQHFTAEHRPQVVTEIYNSADKSPAEVLRRFDASTPADEVAPSTVFHLMPVITRPYNGIQEEHLDKCTAHVFPEKEYPKPKVRKRPESTYSVQSDIINVDPDLPSLEELTLKNALSVPTCAVDVVEVDTGGASFDRMCSLRQSQRESLYSSMPTLKRRQTFSGERENSSMQRNTPYTCSVRQRPWTMHANDRTVSNPVMTSDSLQCTPEPQSHKPLAKNTSQKKGTMSRLRRALSFSKLKTKSSEELPPNHLSTVTEGQNKTDKAEKKTRKFSSWLPKFLKRSKSKKNLSVPRSQSDNFGGHCMSEASELIHSQEMDKDRMDPMRYKISKRNAFSMPDVSDAEDTPVRQLAGSPLPARCKAATLEPAYRDQETVVLRRGPSSQRNSSHRLSFRRSLVLISDSKLMETAVALRDSNTAMNSSSGIWSGSSNSTGQSTDSVQYTVDTSSSPGHFNQKERPSGAPEWRGPQFVKEGDYCFESRSSSKPAPDLYTVDLTQNNLRFHNTINGNVSCMDDDKSSTHSEDEDGYFTSMKSDSGLKRSRSVSISSPSTRAMENASGPRRCTSAQIFDKKEDENSLKSASSLSGSENISSQSASTTSNTSIDSVIYVPLRSSVKPPSKIDGAKLQNKSALRYLSESDFQGKVTEYDPSKRSSLTMDLAIASANLDKLKKAKPLPPVRKSSLLNMKLDTTISNVDKTVPVENMFSDLKQKTLISAAKFPSTVSISSDESDADRGSVVGRRQTRKLRPSSADNLLNVAQEQLSCDQKSSDCSHEVNTLPRSCKSNEMDRRSMSWPRRPKKERPGILKRGDREGSTSGIRQSKTLNFATHVNYIERTPPTSPEMSTKLPQDHSCFVRTEPYRKPFIYLPDPVTSRVRTRHSLSDVPEQDRLLPVAKTRSCSLSNHYASSEVVPVIISRGINKVSRSMSLNVPKSQISGDVHSRCRSESRSRSPSQNSVNSIGRTSSSSGTLCDDVFGSCEVVENRLPQASSQDSLPRRRSRPSSTSPYNSLTRNKNSSSSVSEEIPEKYQPTIRVKAGSKTNSAICGKEIPLYDNTNRLLNSKSSDSLSSTTSGLSNSSGSTQTSGILIRAQRSNSVNVRSNPLLGVPSQRPKSEFIRNDGDIVETLKKSGSKSSECLPTFNLTRDIPDCISLSSRRLNSDVDKSDNKSYYEKVYGSYVPPFLKGSMLENGGWKRSSISSCDSGVGSEDKCNIAHQIQRSISENGPYNRPVGNSCGGPITVAVEIHDDTLKKSSKSNTANYQTVALSEVDPMRDSGISENGFLDSKPLENGGLFHKTSVSVDQTSLTTDFRTSFPPMTASVSRTSDMVMIENKANMSKLESCSSNQSGNVLGYVPIGIKTSVVPLYGEQKRTGYLKVGQPSTPTHGYKRPGSFNTNK